MTKPRPDSFSEKISPAQTQQLIDWLADHTYSETRELISIEPPDGFGLDVSIPTICRFYKKHYSKIVQARQEKLGLRAAEQEHFADTLDEGYRSNIDKGSTLCLQERLYEFLTRPIETVDELKKLVYICKELKNLNIQLDPEEERKDRALKALVGHPLDKVLPEIHKKVKSMRAAESGQDEPSDDEQPAA